MRLILLSASLSAFVFLAGCGANTGILNPSSAAAPTILGTGLQTNGVATNREIDVKFSTAMDPSTITPKTFLLADAKSGASIAGAVAYDATNFVASFKASAPLDVNTSYNATVTTGAANTAGVHLASNYAFSFVTRSTSDSSGIIVYETFPKDGQTGVSVNSNIQIVFSEGATSSTVNTQTFVVRDSKSNIIPGTVTYDILTNYATFTPSALFLPGATYRVVINGVTDLSGQPMPAAQAFTFTTAAVVVAPLQDLVYEADVTTGTISGFTYVPSTNAITQVSSGPSGLEPVQLIPSPDGGTLYVVMGEQPVGVHGSNCLDFHTEVYSYAVDHTTGTLAQESILTLSGFCANAAAIDPLGRFLYVGEVDATTSTGLIDTISLTTGGQMSLVSGSPFTSPQLITSLALSGSYLYAASNTLSGPDGLLTFQRDLVTGSVQFVSGTPLPPQDSVAVSPSGNTLYTIGTNTGLITEYQISAGAMTQSGTVAGPPAPTGYLNFHLSVDPQGRYVGVGSSKATTLYSVDASGNIIPTGTIVLAPAPGAPGTITFDTTGAAATVTEESTSGAASVLDFFNLTTGVAYGNYTSGPPLAGPVTMFTK